MTLIIGPSSAAIDEIRKMRRSGALNRVTVFVAWARVTGVAYFLDALGADIEKVRIVVGMAGAGTSAEALSYLREHCAEVYLFHKHHRQTFHPKIWCFDEPGDPPVISRLIVGSSNMTGGGLYSNFEGNYIATLKPAASADDLAIWQYLTTEFHTLSTSPYCERITDDDRIQALLDERYLSTEIALRRRSGRDGMRAAKAGTKRAKPEAPPPPMVLPELPPATRSFVDPTSAPTSTPATPLSPSTTLPFVADGRFFVRTLTANDVAKALGHQAGAFEPDLGLNTRDKLPGFWGWPDKFATITHRTTPREEWNATALLFSSARPAGVNLNLIIWFRAARAGHAAEFRLRPTITEFREALPSAFSVSTIVVFERLPPTETSDFRIRIINPGEPEFDDFRSYLRTTRPGHSNGYGPDDPDE